MMLIIPNNSPLPTHPTSSSMILSSVPISLIFMELQISQAVFGIDREVPRGMR